MAERIRITVHEQGQINWSRGGVGMTVKEFVEQFPCEAIKIVSSHGLLTELGEALVSTIGGSGKLIEFNRMHMCDGDEGKLQQI